MARITPACVTRRASCVNRSVVPASSSISPDSRSHTWRSDSTPRTPSQSCVGSASVFAPASARRANSSPRLSPSNLSSSLPKSMVDSNLRSFCERCLQQFRSLAAPSQRRGEDLRGRARHGLEDACACLERPAPIVVQAWVFATERSLRKVLRCAAVTDQIEHGLI